VDESKEKWKKLVMIARFKGFGDDWTNQADRDAYPAAKAALLAQEQPCASLYPESIGQQYACSQQNAAIDGQIVALTQATFGTGTEILPAGFVTIPPPPLPQTYESFLASGGGGNTSQINSTPIGTLTFSPSRSGGILYPGDTWTITISGAQPNQSILVTGGVGGAQNKTPTGTTDGSGNFSLSGTIDSTEIGIWNEVWSVNGVTVGSIAFTVAATPPTGSPSGGGGAVVTPPATDVLTSIENFLQETFAVGGVDIPYWVVGIVGIGYLLMKSPGRR
jgi:hypothetical protein